MSITTVAGTTYEAMGWPGAIAFTAWCACWASIWWSVAYVQVHGRQKDKDES